MLKKLKIGIFGSAVTEGSAELITIAKTLGKQIALDKHTIITGACRGLPFEAVIEAKQNQGYSIGYTAVSIESEHENKMGTQTSMYDKLELIPSSYKHKNNICICRKYRNVSSVADCDIALFISGRWGTLNEFAIAYDMGKTIGVVTQIGKFAPQVAYLLDYFDKDTDGAILFNHDPILLYNETIARAKSALL